jgi:hypothetical protein
MSYRGYSYFAEVYHSPLKTSTGEVRFGIVRRKVALSNPSLQVPTFNQKPCEIPAAHGTIQHRENIENL